MRVPYMTWKGRPVEELSRDELIEIIISLGHMLENEIEETKRERTFWFSVNNYSEDIE